MADNVENIILEQLRALRSEIAEMRTELRDHRTEFREFRDGTSARLQAIDLQITGLHSTSAEFRQRFDRIERRLELADADA